MGWYNSDGLKLTLADSMKQFINNEPVNVEESILHHQESLNLIPSNLKMPFLEKYYE